MDIVERLRSIDHMNIEQCFLASHLYTKAADEIERLREALEEVCNYSDLDAVRVARAALKGQS